MITSSLLDWMQLTSQFIAGSENTELSIDTIGNIWAGAPFLRSIEAVVVGRVVLGTISVGVFGCSSHADSHTLNIRLEKKQS